MPDWSYRTVLRPALFALPPEAARRLTCAVLGGIARVPGGSGFIDFLGHMRADAQLARSIGGCAFPGPMGLGALIDPAGRASSAFARFGVGFLEVGPVWAGAEISPSWRRDTPAASLHMQRAARMNLAQLSATLTRDGTPCPLWFRIAADEPDPALVCRTLQPWAAGFAVEVSDPGELPARVQAVSLASSAPLVLSIAADQVLDAHALELGTRGVWVRGELAHSDGGSVHGPTCLPRVLERIRELRARLPSEALLIAGGVGQPEDVRQLARAGAQLYAADAGLVFSGPALIKRCNEALWHELSGGSQPALEPISLGAARRAWFWAFCLGLAMCFGGALAFAIANTRVVLPYDESLCGLNRAQLAAVNPRLLPFMRHDRVTLASSMLSIGILYAALALHGLRRGMHWAQVTVIVSAFTGFLSLFYFLGFGYFDPFHAFVSAILFQLLLLCSITEMPAAAPPLQPEWRETAAWRAGLWGQLLFVVTGIGLVGAGLVITYIGLTDVFVREDLEFMRTAAAQLLTAHERLVPLVAHDRASLGGMLIANGIAILLCALWGFRRGERWLWRALAWAGGVAYGGAISVHYVVGYVSALHLAPAFAGLALWSLALALTRPWLCARHALSD